MNETNTYKKFKDSPQDNFPNKFIIHHSGGTDADPLADTSHHTAEMMEQYHLSKGWEGLGYHYVIHKDGEIWKGRPEHYHGAHTKGQNTSSIGICLAGNFDATLPTEEQVSSLRSLLIGLKAKYNIENIFPHRKFASKTCYGKNLSDDWASRLTEQSKEEACLPYKRAIEEKDGIINLLTKLLRTLLGWK